MQIIIILLRRINLL